MSTAPRVNLEGEGFVKYTDPDVPASYKKVLAALRKLDVEWMRNVFAHAFKGPEREAWMHANKVTEADEDHVCIQRLIHGRCVGRENETLIEMATYESHPCHPPGFDHGDLWLKDGQPEIFTFQPYHLFGSTLQALLTFCQKNNLEIEINGRSWYYGANSVLVEIRRVAPGKKAL